MMRTGLIGGPLADHLLRHLGERAARKGYCDGSGHRGRRSRFKQDGATRFAEVEGGLNQMTIGRFRRLVAGSPLRFETFETVPIRRLRVLANPLTREFVTGSVRCSLRPRGAS
jgi:hypothetical protein